jgi:hypothetical protein
MRDTGMLVSQVACVLGKPEAWVRRHDALLQPERVGPLAMRVYSREIVERVAAELAAKAETAA